MPHTSANHFVLLWDSQRKVCHIGAGGGFADILPDNDITTLQSATHGLHDQLFQYSISHYSDFHDVLQVVFITVTVQGGINIWNNCLTATW